MSFKSSGKPYARHTPGGIPDGQWLHDKAPGGDRVRVRRTVETNTSHTPSAKLLVDNLHYEVSEKDLANLFGKYGSFAKEPRIRFDRSGRSTGSAVVVFNEVEDALAAKKALHKQLAKGQELEIRFDDSTRGVGRGSSSLLARIEKGPSKGSLTDRLGDGNNDVNMADRSGGGVGPHRTRGRGRGRGGAAPRERGPKKPLTADDLDKELEAYGAASDNTPAAVQAESVSGPAATTNEDVEMA
ncbi:RNA-binding domain-containing protein [Serendipita vermifera]|nr:RNA-binding domain-containing protein [Serendipita vermifera]